MKKRKIILAGLVLTMTVSVVLSGCKKKTVETESESETVKTVTTEAETVKQTETTKKASKVTFKSKDGSLSIKLPDDTWQNKEEKDGSQWKFESADAGTITIVHYTGTDMQGLTFPASEEEVLENLESAGKSKTDYAVVQYKKDTLGSYDAYHTTIKCKKSDATYAYSVAYNLVGSDDIYSVNGQVKEDDATAMETIRTAVESLKLLNSSATTKETTKSTDQSETTESTAQSESTSSTNGQYLYDSNGNSIYIYQDSNGNYVDNYGNTYTMTETGAESSSGASYTYNQPSSSDSGTTTQTESTSFYDTYGNQIYVYKDSNGNWVDNNGIVYSFGQYGVTDNYGNYYPYDGSSTSQTDAGTGGGGTSTDTNGFYDDQGNWITVYQDSNGNWIDSGGMEYTFGDSGVTDSYGNYYPY